MKILIEWFDITDYMHKHSVTYMYYYIRLYSLFVKISFYLLVYLLRHIMNIYKDCCIIGRERTDSVRLNLEDDIAKPFCILINKSMSSSIVPDSLNDKGAPYL